MTLCQATECVFEIPEGFIDDTGYEYERGPVNVVTGPYATLSEWRKKVEDALDKFRTSVPAYELIERRSIEQPVPGAELVVLRVGGSIDVFELSIFWPIGDTMWAFRSRGPQAVEDACREAAQAFLETYEPLGAEES